MLTPILQERLATIYPKIYILSSQTPPTEGHDQCGSLTNQISPTQGGSNFNITSTLNILKIVSKTLKDCNPLSNKKIKKIKDNHFRFDREVIFSLRSLQ